MELYLAKKGFLEALAQSPHVVRISYKTGTPLFAAHCVILDESSFWTEAVTCATLEYIKLVPHRDAPVEVLREMMDRVLHKAPVKTHKHPILHADTLVRTTTLCLVMGFEPWRLSDAEICQIAQCNDRCNVSCRLDTMEYSVHGDKYMVADRNACVRIPLPFALSPPPLMRFADEIITENQAGLVPLADQAFNCPSYEEIPTVASCVDTVQLCLAMSTPNKVCTLLTYGELEFIRDCLLKCGQMEQ